jgi:hypothetical protein
MRGYSNPKNVRHQERCCEGSCCSEGVPLLGFTNAAAPQSSAGLGRMTALPKSRLPTAFFSLLQ